MEVFYLTSHFCSGILEGTIEGTKALQPVLCAVYPAFCPDTIKIIK